MIAMDNLDLHMLRVLEEVYKTGSLSRTADRLGLSQPGVSMALARLREHFNDPLFIRVGNEMKPTPQAEGMRQKVAAAIAAIEDTLHYRLEFVPAETERVFRICVTDIGQVVMVPKFLAAFKQAAPRASLEFTSIDTLTPERLQTGALDLAVGVISQAGSGLYQQALFRESFLCLARAEHPRLRNELTLAQFKEESHVVVTTSSATHLYVESVLAGQHIHRRVAVRLPNFLLLSHLVATTDHLATLPRRAALAMAEQDPRLKTHEPPLTMPTVAIMQYWHERQARDPGTRWVRELFSSLFGETASAAG